MYTFHSLLVNNTGTRSKRRSQNVAEIIRLNLAFKNQLFKLNLYPDVNLKAYVKFEWR